MPKQNIGKSEIIDPYRLLALSILEEAFRTIKCYFLNCGTKEELTEGKSSIRWIKKMEGTFKLIAIAAHMPISRFHQACLWKISCLKKEALSEKHGQPNLD